MSDERDYCILGDAWAQLIREYRRKPIDSLRRSLDVRCAVASYTHRRHPNAPDPASPHMEVVPTRCSLLLRLAVNAGLAPPPLPPA
jgi:hypothetical protein